MDLPILTRDTSPAASQPILDGIAADLGFVPNLVATLAASPSLAGFDGLRRAVGGESFDRCTARSPGSPPASPQTTPMASPSTRRSSAASASTRRHRDDAERSRAQ